MRAIIERKVYDTETATLLAEWDNSTNRGDFHAIEEKLYRTRKGRFFVHGWGGALTRYAEQSYGMYGASSRIEPLSTNAAIQWLEERGLVDAIEQHFQDAIKPA